MTKKKINWTRLTIVMIAEIFFGIVIFYSYPIISMLLLGEGASSFLYASANGFIWAISPLIILIYDIFQIFNAKKMDNVIMINTYKLISILYSSMYGLFILYWLIFNRFHV